MKPKTTRCEDNKKPEYPCLKEGSSGIIVLFTSKCTGMVVGCDTKHTPVGYYSESWGYASFKPFKGTVKLIGDCE